MAPSLQHAAALLLFAALASAQNPYYYTPSSTAPVSSAIPAATPSPSAASAGAAAGAAAHRSTFYTRVPMLLTAHAVLATLAFGLIFPLGGIVMRLLTFRGVWAAHAGLQVLGLALYTGAFGVGIYLATHFSLLMDPHIVIGIVLFILVWLQPLSGLLHHVNFLRRGARGLDSHLHVWLGRVVLTLGVVNGGLGLRLASKNPGGGPPTGAIIAYGVLAGLMWLIYVAAAVWGEMKKGRADKGKEMEDVEYVVASSQQKEGARPGSA